MDPVGKASFWDDFSAFAPVHVPSLDVLLEGRKIADTNLEKHGAENAEAHYLESIVKSAKMLRTKNRLALCLSNDSVELSRDATAPIITAKDCRLRLSTGPGQGGKRPTDREWKDAKDLNLPLMVSVS